MKKETKHTSFFLTILRFILRTLWTVRKLCNMKIWHYFGFLVPQLFIHFKMYFIILCIWVIWEEYQMCLCNTGRAGSWSLKKALDTLGLEFHVVVSYHLGASNQTCVFCKGKKYFPSLSHFSSSKVPHFYYCNLLYHSGVETTKNWLTYKVL